MAELYSIGVHRIFYRASPNSPSSVVAKILSPDLTLEASYTFSPVPGTSRAFYADINFNEEGVWIATFYEDGEEKTSQAYNTKRLLTLGGYDVTVIGGSKGPSVIN